MLCPACHTAILDAVERCPACGDALQPGERIPLVLAAQPEAGPAAVNRGSVGSTSPPTAVRSHGRGVAEQADGRTENEKSGKNGNIAQLDDAARHAVTTLVVSGPVPTPAPLVKRLPELTIRMWRQPAVRAAVKTGAGTLALSLALSVARRALASRAARATVPSLPSLVLDAWSQGERPGEGRGRRVADRNLVVEEVLIYSRRVTRR